MTPTLPDTQTAFNNLFMGIHQRVFLQKVANAGYPARNQQEAQWQLETAGKLRQLEQAQPVKAAADEQNPYYQANNALDSVMAQYGLSTSVKQAKVQEETLAIKQAAQELAQDPTFYNSVLALKAAEAEEIKTHLATQKAPNRR